MSKNVKHRRNYLQAPLALEPQGSVDDHIDFVLSLTTQMPGETQGLGRTRMTVPWVPWEGTLYCLPRDGMGNFTQGVWGGKPESWLRVFPGGSGAVQYCPKILLVSKCIFRLSS